MFGFVRGVRGRAVAVVLIVAGLLGGVTASSVAAATKTTVKWKVSSLTAGQVKSLSAIATSNSPGVKTWSKTGSCTLMPTRKPTTLTMGSTGGSCTLTLKIAKTGKYPAKTSTKIITRKSATTTTVAATTTTVALTCATGASCAVGDTGPGGGVVFYDAGSTQSWGRYLEAAPVATEVDRTWATGANQSADVTGADGTAIGTGAANTLEIVNQTGNEDATSAAVYCDSLSYGGFTDWFLPSKDELNEMYIQRTAIGGLSSTYWSSSERRPTTAWYQDFGTGNQDFDWKYYAFYVRPVRAF
jgi:hypothetical protein